MLTNVAVLIGNAISIQFLLKMKEEQQKSIPIKSSNIFEKLNLIVEEVETELDLNKEVQLLNTSKKQIPKTYSVYIPRNLNIDELISNYPPNIHRFHKDKLMYIINLIYSIPMRIKDFDFEAEDGYVPINSEILKFRVREYADYLKYLVETGVFEKRTNYKYKVGVTSSGYRFTDRYNTVPKRMKISRYRLIKAICSNNKKEEKIIVDVSKEPLDYLEKWWNDKLQFDYTEAKKWLDETLQKEVEQNKPHCERRYFVRRIVIEKFKNREFIIHQDSTSGRVHTLLTQLKSELRQFINYDGQILVAIDIVNSQPYLAIALINEDAFLLNKMSDRIKLYNDRNGINSSIMLALSNEKNEPKNDLNNFLEFVANGEFYEMFGQLLLKNGLVLEEDKEQLRKFTKKVMFASMFGHNNEKCEKKDKVTKKITYIPNMGMKLFKQTFPTVFEFFKIIKTGSHNTLACVLQHFESELVVHRACKIISEERPDIPIYTIHDSIVTTEKNAKYVKRVMSDVLLEAIGIAPTITEVHWIEKAA